jgi:hypothetical protein
MMRFQVLGFRFQQRKSGKKPSPYARGLGEGFNDHHQVYFPHPNLLREGKGIGFAQFRSLS